LLKVENARRQGNLSANLQHKTLTVQHEITQRAKDKRKNKHDRSVRKANDNYEQGIEESIIKRD